MFLKERRYLRGRIQTIVHRLALPRNARLWNAIPSSSSSPPSSSSSPNLDLLSMAKYSIREIGAYTQYGQNYSHEITKHSKMCNDYLYTKMVKYYPHQMFTIVCMWVTKVISVCMHPRTMTRPMLLPVSLKCLCVWWVCGG